MWKQMILKVFPEARFADSVGVAALDSAEGRLGCPLPAELRELLQEAGGVRGHYDVDTVWTLEQIVQQNLYFRSAPDFADLYMPFGPLLFFGDNGGGDQFAFVQIPRRPDIFVWDHESDSRSWVANNLSDYLSRSLTTSSDDWYR